MVVLLTCKNEEGPIKMKALKVIHTFFKHARAANSAVSGGIQTKFEHIQAFMVVLVTCTNEEDPIKNEGARVLEFSHSHYNPMGAICCHGNQISFPKTYCSIFPPQ